MLRKYLPLLAITILFTGFLPLSGAAQNVSVVAAGTAMTNADVIGLVEAGMSDDIVAAKIQAAPATAFDTSVNGLTALKAAKVSNAVIRVMISPHPAVASANPYSAANPAVGGNPDDPIAPHSPGIYTLTRGADGQMHMVKLEGSKPRGAKSSGMFLHALTQGITTSKLQQVIDGASATIELSQTRPVFYAYIPDSSGSFVGGMSAKDLVLTKLEVKGDTRLWTQAARGLIGGSSEVGSDEKDRQGFTTEQIKPGIYKLTPAADLAAGQYAFKYAFTYFDFGIQPGATTQSVAPQSSETVNVQTAPPPLNWVSKDISETGPPRTTGTEARLAGTAEAGPIKGPARLILSCKSTALDGGPKAFAAATIEVHSNLIDFDTTAMADESSQYNGFGRSLLAGQHQITIDTGDGGKSTNGNPMIDLEYEWQDLEQIVNSPGATLTATVLAPGNKGHALTLHFNLPSDAGPLQSIMMPCFSALRAAEKEELSGQLVSCPANPSMSLISIDVLEGPHEKKLSVEPDDEIASTYTLPKATRTRPRPVLKLACNYSADPDNASAEQTINRVAIPAKASYCSIHRSTTAGRVRASCR